MNIAAARIAAVYGFARIEDPEAFRARLEEVAQAGGVRGTLLVAHEGINRLVLGWMTGNGLAAVQAFEQDLACINVLDFDLVPAERGQGVEIARRIIKAVNLTPYNYVKHGMNLTSLEFIFERYEERPDE